MSTKNVLAMVSPMSYERVCGIARYAKEHGRNLMIQDRLGHTPLVWHGDGLIATLRSDAASYRMAETMMRRGIPLVDLTITRPDVKVPRVTSDHRGIGRLAARHFADRAFRHVAWFSTAWGNVHRLRYEGFAEDQPEPPPMWVVANEIAANLQNDWNCFVRWFHAKFAAATKPLAVLAYDETDGARLLYAARQLGISVPEELSILTIGNNALICENQSVSLSSIDQNLEVGGYEAAALLDRMMSRKQARRSRAAETEVRLVPPAGIVTRRSTDTVAVADAMVRRALAFIEDNLGKPIGSPQIADALGCRRGELDRRFSVQLGHSVGGEIRRRRLAQARLLLETTGQPISAIAGATGYCTPSHLTNAFKATFGLSPKAWRQGQRTPTAIATAAFRG